MKVFFMTIHSNSSTFKVVPSKHKIHQMTRRSFGVSGSYGYSIFYRYGNDDSNVGKQNLKQFEECKNEPHLLKKKNFYFTKWPGAVSKLGASYFFNKKYNMGFYHVCIENKHQKESNENIIQNLDLILLSSTNKYATENKQIENKLKDLTCGYAVQIVLMGKGVKCYYEEVHQIPKKRTYRSNVKQYYVNKKTGTMIKQLESNENHLKHTNAKEKEKTEKENNTSSNDNNSCNIKKGKRLFVRLGIGTKNIDVTRVLTMHKKSVNIDVDKTGTIIQVYGYNKKYVGSVSHRLYKIVKMNVYTMKGGYVYLHKPKQKVPKKK